MSAIPGATDADDEEVLEGELPSAIDPPTGCRFNTRCPYATEICQTDEPEILEVRPGHFTACHHPVL